MFVVAELIPELMRRSVLTRHREHNNVTYRLTDSAKDDARRLLVDNEEQGRIRDVLDRLAGGA